MFISCDATIKWPVYILYWICYCWELWRDCHSGSMNSIVTWHRNAYMSQNHVYGVGFISILFPCVKNILVFLMSCKQLRNTWRTEQLFSETWMSRKHDRFACFPLFAMLDRRCIFRPLVKKSTLISNREIYVHYENCFEVTYLFCLILRDFKNSS